MLRGTTVSTKLPMWKLMMKKCVFTRRISIAEQNFKLNIKFLSDTTGTEINYLPVGAIANQPLLQVMNLTASIPIRNRHSDGFF